MESQSTVLCKTENNNAWEPVAGNLWFHATSTAAKRRCVPPATFTDEAALGMIDLSVGKQDEAGPLILVGIWLF